MRLVRAELLKIRTTGTWRALGLVFLGLWVLTLGMNLLATRLGLEAGGDIALDPETGEFLTDTPAIAANLYTNGQFFGLLIVMLFAAIIVTSEFFQQTATSTFLQTPRRELVLGAKLVAATVVGLAFWLLSTVLNLALGPVVLATSGAGPQLGEGRVWQAIMLNGLAYALWAILGVGAGVLIRSQLAATIMLSVVYVVGYLGTSTFFLLIGDRFGTWFPVLQVLIPPQASQLLVNDADLPGDPARWIGAVVLVGYALITGLAGTAIMRKRDIT